MNPTDRSRIEVLFLAACDLAKSERDCFLDRECGGSKTLRSEVEKMLAADEESLERSNSIVERLHLKAMSSGDDHTVTVGAVGQQHGMYRLTELLGTGGMGEVWRAERNDDRFEGEVAIKLLRAGISNIAASKRFEQEGRLLAKLDHPNIARLLDAGVSKGQLPYLVLELIEGEPINEHCDRLRLGITARVRLFLEVLAGVAHAHNNLIVHRDIKPANVFVTSDGSVKLLDFGIATLLHGHKSSGQGPLTLEYGSLLTPEFAAPEQLVGDTITTATDVYSLGLLLYVLLVGKSPRKGSDASELNLADVLKAASTEVPKPSTQVTQHRKPRAASRALRGDLDNIIAKALAVNAVERYGSASDFSADLYRFLEGEPVSATAPTMRYRAHKFISRHRGGVLSTFLSAVALIGAVVISTMQTLEARKQRDNALYQQQRVQAGNEFYSLLLEEMSAEGKTFTAVELLDRGAEMLSQQYKLNKPFVGRIHYDLSRRYSNLRETDRELALLEVAETSAQANEDWDLLAVVLCSRARTFVFSDPEKSREEYDQGSKALALVDYPSIDSRIACMRMKAQLLETEGLRDEAIAALVEVTQWLDESPIGTTHLRGITLNDRAFMYFKDGRYGESLNTIDEILELLQETGRGQTLGYLQILANRSAILGTIGEVAKEAEVRKLLLERLENSQWENNRASIPYRSGYGSTLVRLSRYEEGIELVSKVLEESKALNNQQNASLANLILARAFEATDQLEKAKKCLEAATAVFDKNPHQLEFQRVRADMIQANIAMKLGSVDEAQTIVDQVLERYDYPENFKSSAALATTLKTATVVELALQNYVSAEALASDYLRIKESVARRADQSADVGNALFLRAKARVGLGKLEEAKNDLNRAIVSLSNGLGEQNPEVAEARAVLGRVN